MSSIRLHAREGVESPARVTPIHDAPSGRLTVLVVEDDDFQREVLVELVEILGADRVLDASDGNAAVSVLERSRLENRAVDLVLCDIDMPGMCGLSFLEHLADAPYSPAVAFTSAGGARMMSEVREKCKRDRIRLVAALDKPISPTRIESLLVEVENSLDDVRVEPARARAGVARRR